METLRIDGYIGKDDGMSLLFGGSPNFSLKSLNEFLDNLPAGTKELKVEINSGGGSVTEGFAIHDKLVSSGLIIHTEVLGLCGSIATIIALSAKKENRSMHENSDYFIHNPYWQPMAPDAMEADDLERLASELRDSQEKILSFYVSKTDQKRGILKSFMDESKGFSSKEAKDFGFVNTIIGEAVNTRKYQIAAFIDPAKNKSQNMEFTAQQKSWIEQKLNALSEKFNHLFTPVFKLMMMELQSGGKIFIDSEDAKDIKGKKVFAVDDSGNQTNNAAPDGEYTFQDGRTITVSGGIINDVKEAAAPADDTAALKKEVDELKAKLEASEKKATVTAEEKTALEQNVVALKREVHDFKNTILGGQIPPKEGQEFKGSEGSEGKKSQAQLLKEYQEKQNKK